MEHQQRIDETFAVSLSNRSQGFDRLSPNGNMEASAR
jgi:hypothetical protein